MVLQNKKMNENLITKDVICFACNKSVILQVNALLEKKKLELLQFLIQ